MIGDVGEFTLTCEQNQQYTVFLAKEIALGVVVYRLPDGMHPTNPNRWRIGHKHSGLAIADAPRKEAAVKGAELCGTLADWTQDAASLRANIDANAIYIRLSFVDCVVPNSERMTGDVCHNGTYGDEDIAEAAREAKADGMNGLDILLSMTHTVPWMGLDTDAFNEAHDRIVTLAGVA